jgi:hypothetical protein
LTIRSRTSVDCVCMVKPPVQIVFNAAAASQR